MKIGKYLEFFAVFCESDFFARTNKDYENDPNTKPRKIIEWHVIDSIAFVE